MWKIMLNIQTLNAVISYVPTYIEEWNHVEKALCHFYANQAELKFDRLPENVYSVDLVDPRGQVSWPHSSEMQSQYNTQACVLREELRGILTQLLRVENNKIMKLPHTMGCISKRPRAMFIWRIGEKIDR